MEPSRRQIFLGAALVAAMAPMHGKAEARRRGSVAWRGRAGLNVFWPFGGPVAHEGQYLDDPYATCESGHFASHIDASVITQIKAAKVDHVRLQVSPGPWLQAAASGKSVDFLDRCLDMAVTALTHAGIGVLLSPYLSSYTAVDVPEDILQDVRSPGYLRFRSLLVRWGRRYGTEDPKLFALELMNEPPHPSGFAADWQAAVQPDLYEAVRAAAPSTTIVLTAENFSSLYLLSHLDPKRYDGNVVYTFHPFLPSCFCLQGAAYDKRYKYVTGLSYPPRDDERQEVLEAVKQNIQADVSLDAAHRDSRGRSLAEELGYFFDYPGFEGGQNASWVDAQFALVQSWAIRSDIPASAIYVGEWGAVRRNRWQDSLGRAQGADAESRARYYSDVAAIISRRGFRSSLDHLDTYDYGVTDGSGAEIAELDSNIMNAVQENLGRPAWA